MPRLSKQQRQLGMTVNPPGRLGLSDFTVADKLGVTLADKTSMLITAASNGLGAFMIITATTLGLSLPNRVIESVIYKKR